MSASHIETDQAVAKLAMAGYEDRAAVADRLGIRPETVSRYLTANRMPEPDGHMARSPWWYERTITAWQAARPGKGKGAGRPRKSRTA